MNTHWRKLAKEYCVSLFPIFMLADAFTRPIRKLLNVYCPVAFCITRKEVDYYYHPQKWQEAHQALVKKIQNDPHFLRNAFHEMERLGKKQVATLTKYTHNLTRSSNAKLWHYYRNYAKTNTKVYAVGVLLPLVDYQDTTFLSDTVHRILKRYHAEKYFVALTTPIRVTYNRQQDVDLLQIFKRMYTNKKLVRLFCSTPVAETINVLKHASPSLHRLLLAHVRKYCWVYYVYQGPAVDATYFVETLRDLMKRRVNPGKELSKIERDSAAITKKQKYILGSLPFTQAEKNLICLARDSVFYKPYRRELQSHAHFLIDRILTEIGKRVNVSLAQVRMMLPREVEAVLLQHKVDVHALNARLQCVVYGAPKSDSCLSGQVAARYAKKHFPVERIPRLSHELHGVTAYGGKVRGVVRIINTPDEMEKMKRGDILVATTTNPNLMPAVRLSSALLTDEGGLTCHAAIVSRELKIPCIVGLQYITQAVKDGDRVEVDATNGVVRKI